jgi:hypothetical protein
MPTYIVKIAAHDMHVACQRFQVVVRLFRAQVSGHQDVVDPAWDEQFFKFTRQTRAPGSYSILSNIDTDIEGLLT